MVASLVHYLEFSPTDAEAWSEMADVYFTQGAYAQAIFAMEEVLILAPNAWNVSLCGPQSYLKLVVNFSL